jgi:hypothetical protein
VGILIALVVVLAVGWAAWTAIIVMRGNNYHALLRQAVVAQVGAKATPYLESRPIIEQITNAFRRGDPASSTALALAMLIEQGESEDDGAHEIAEHEEEQEEEEDKNEGVMQEAVAAQFSAPTLHQSALSYFQAAVELTLRTLLRVGRSTRTGLDC